MASSTRGAFVLAIVLSALCVPSPGFAQDQPASCQAIRKACRDAGFVVGGPAGDRLMIDCFEPIVHGAPRSASGARPLPEITAQLTNNCQAQLGPAVAAPYQPAPRVQAPFQPSASKLEVDLRPEIDKLALPVKDQGPRGTCSIFATTFLIEYQAARAQRPNGSDLSEEYLNWAKNQANRTDFDGGKFSDIIRGYEAFGMVAASDMPDMGTFDPKHPATPQRATIAAGKAFPRFRFAFIKEWNNQNGMSDKELDAAKAALRSGRPVATGIWWLNHFETVMVQRVPLLKEYPRGANKSSDPAKNPMFDGHSIDLVGYHEGAEFPGGGYFVFRNSFGPRFGHSGYGFVSFDYMHNYANDAIVIQP
jgi:Papain family cysteine protease